MCATIVNVITINLSLEHPKRNVDAWRNFFQKRGKSYHVIALQECLNNDGTNFAQQILTDKNYVVHLHNDILGNCDWNGDQVLLFEKEFYQQFLLSPSRISFASIHLSSADYIPKLLSDQAISVEQVHEIGKKARAQELENHLANFSSSENCVAMGDFNEPSHLDTGIEYYCSTTMAQNGFSDVRHPDAPPTWPTDLYDCVAHRIDFIYYKGNDLTLLSYATIDTGLSDHAAVEATFKLNY